MVSKDSRKKQAHRRVHTTPWEISIFIYTRRTGYFPSSRKHAHTLGKFQRVYIQKYPYSLYFTMNAYKISHFLSHACSNFVIKKSAIERSYAEVNPLNLP